MMRSSRLSDLSPSLETPPGLATRPATRPLPSRPPALSPQRHYPGSHTLAAVQSLGYIIVVALFIVTFSLQPFRIPSGSMEPTLLIGDFLLVDKLVDKPPSAHPSLLDPLPPGAIHRGDIVVFHFPVDPGLHLVKRVIGLPGDRLRMRNGRVFINEVPLAEPYAVYSPAPHESFRDDFPHLQSTDPDVNARWWSELQHLVDHGELRIPPGHFFVLGDNRNNSEDSRYWGLVPRASIVGEPFLVYFSLRTPAADGDLPSSLGHTLAHLARWHRILHIIH